MYNLSAHVEIFFDRLDPKKLEIYMRFNSDPQKSNPHIKHPNHPKSNKKIPG